MFTGYYSKEQSFVNCWFRDFFGEMIYTIFMREVQLAETGLGMCSDIQTVLEVEEKVCLPDATKTHCYI